MSSLLNNASLLLNPAGSIISYQEDKIYSVLPKDGTGDFTFSGGDGGTRVNQQGYVAPTPVNLLSNTNTFSGWNLEGGTIAGGFSDPEGGNTAHKYTSIGGNGLWSSLVAFGVAVGYGSGYPLPGSITFSFWIKSVTGNNMTAAIGDGVATSGGTVNITGTWQYITRSIVPNGPWGGFYLNGLSDPTNGYYIWHPQINIGTTALPYQPTTDRLNYPRITYQNGRGALMGELQRTNYVLSSSSCNWGGYQGSTLTLNNAISPDGTQNATLLTVSTTQYSGVYYQVNRGTEVPVVSIFAKAGTLPFIYFVNPAGNALVAWYDLRNGTVSNVTAGYNAYMEPYKDGWYRCVLGCPSQTNNYLQLGVTNTSGADAASYSGTIYIWGGQNEVGTFGINYATSYIPTTTATVTRPQDLPYAGGVSSLVGQSSGGTLYVSGVPRASEQEFAAITPGGYTTVDGVFLYFGGGNNLRLWVVGGSTVQVGGNSATINVGQYFKAAVRYGNGSTAYYVNGQQIVTTAAALAFSSTLNRIDLRGNAYYYSTPGAQEISTVATYTTGLTNAQLTELTTVRSGSGGNISYYGPYTVHTFIGSGTFTPSFNGEVEVLVVAGGGGGGYDNGGGGGAGGLLYASSYGVAQGTGITVTIGAGGVGGPNGSTKGTNGGNSVFGGLTALGGGGGGSDVNRVGLNGGSGGGTARAEGGSASGLGTPGQGNNGGSAPTSPSTVNGGGGGGAGQVGETSTVANRGGNGGNGLVYSINGFSTYYAGGGGGGSASGESRTNGGLGGGGFGSTGNVYNPTGGTDYLGGGGGGGPGSTSPRDGKNGGIGIVIVRYLT